MRDLWGDLPDAAKLQSPDDILQEQAVLLREKSGGKLIGVVEPVERESRGRGRGNRERSDFEFAFLIRAPLLNDYTYTICQAGHGISFYPVWVYSEEMDDREHCSDMEEFARAIGHILRGDRVRNVVATLLKQTNSRAAASQQPQYGFLVDDPVDDPPF